MWFEQLLLELNEKQANFLLMLGSEIDKESLLDEGVYFDVSDAEEASNVELDTFMLYADNFEFNPFSNEQMNELFNQFPKLLKDVVDAINKELYNNTESDNKNMSEREFLNYTNSNLR